MSALTYTQTHLMSVCVCVLFWSCLSNFPPIYDSIGVKCKNPLLRPKILKTLKFMCLSATFGFRF